MSIPISWGRQVVSVNGEAKVGYMQSVCASGSPSDMGSMPRVKKVPSVCDGRSWREKGSDGGCELWFAHS